MAKLTKSAAAQYPLTVAFRFTFEDTMDNISGTELAFGADDANTTTFNIFTPPPGAMVVGGRVLVKTVFNSTTNTVDLGDSADTNRYTETAPINMKDPDAPATGFDMLGDGYVYDGSESIRMTILNDGAATAGEAIVVVHMVVTGRQNENLKTT